MEKLLNSLPPAARASIKSVLANLTSTEVAMAWSDYQNEIATENQVREQVEPIMEAVFNECRPFAVDPELAALIGMSPGDPITDWHLVDEAVPAQFHNYLSMLAERLEFAGFKLQRHGQPYEWSCPLLVAESATRGAGRRVAGLVFGVDKIKNTITLKRCLVSIETYMSAKNKRDLP